MVQRFDYDDGSMLESKSGNYVLYSEHEIAIKAVEFAEYMAKAAEAYMNSMNRRDAVKIEIDGQGDESDFEEELKITEESLTDHWNGLKSAIYEFRKRTKKIDSTNKIE